MFTFWSDVRYSIRQVLRQPAHAIMVVTLMALGVGGNAAMFRIFNGLFLRPLPFEQAERLVDVNETAPSWDLEYLMVAYRDFAAWRESNRTLTSIAAYSYGGGNFLADEAPRRVSYLRATHDLDDVLRLQPALGRFFDQEEDRPDGARVMLLSQGFWQQELAGDPNVLGRTYSLDGQPYEVIGVLPPEARFFNDPDLWVPMRESETDFNGWGLNSIGRLEDGATVEQALADLTSIHKALIPQWSVNEISTPVMSSLRDRYLGDYRLGSGFLLGAVAIVLLIACANIAGLMTARSLARGPEMAVRTALGAPKGRLVQQLLTESLVLAGVGALFGTALGVWGSGLLMEPLADQFPSWVTFDLDARFLVFTLAVTAGAAVVFGLVPALQASRAGGAAAGSALRTTASPRRRRALGLLVAGEVALAVALLIVGGLTVMDVRALGRVDPGFRADGVVSYQVSLSAGRYPDSQSRLAFAEGYLERLEAIPGVQSAAVGSALPLTDHWGWFYLADGAPPRPEDEANPVVLNRVVSPGYFETMGVQLLAGRPFDDFDGRDEDAPVVIVNETFVRTHLSHLDDPIGARVVPGTDLPEDEEPVWMTVIGVTKDVKHYGVDEEMRPGVYQPLAQLPTGGFYVALRTEADPADVVSVARTETAALDVELPLYGVELMSDRLDESLWTLRATSWLIAAFSAVALLMAIAGIYGVISYTVGQRTQEISIRMAMGAETDRVLRGVLTQGMGLVVAGAAVGLVLVLAGVGLVSGILNRVSATDPVVYVGVTGIVLLVAAIANYLPARRAAALDPMRALRGE